MTAHTPLLVLLATLSLGACSSRDTDLDPGDATLPGSSEGPATDGETSLDDGTPSPGSGPIFVDDPPDTVTPDDGGLPVDTLDPDAVPDEDVTLDPDAAPDENDIFDLDPLPDEGDLTGLPDEPILVPAIPGDANAARVLEGLHLALARTLLDLNGRLSGGVELSEQQEACLGAYEPGLGDPLFAVECDRALATEPVAIYVERGAFHRTDACRADLAGNTADDCVVAYASVFTRTEFVEFPSERRPRPLPGSGIIVRFALDGPILEVESDELALTGAFRCRIDLATGATIPTTIGDCDTALRDVATRFDELFAAVR